MKKREFLKKSAILASTTAIMPSFLLACKEKQEITKTAPLTRLRTAHVGVGNMGAADLNDISSHDKVDVTALCDVDANNLAEAKKLHPNAKTFSDYRVMLKEMGDEIDAVVVSTPDHTHAPVSMMAMEMNKSCLLSKTLNTLCFGSESDEKISGRKGFSYSNGHSSTFFL